MHGGDAVYAVAIAPSGDLLASGVDSSVSVFAMPAATLSLKVGRDEGNCFCLAVMPSGDRILCGLSGGKIRMEGFAAATAAPLRTFAEHTSQVNAVVAMSATTFASASSDQTVRLWDAERSASTATLSGHGGAVYDVVQLDERTLASASWDKTVAVWDTRTTSRTASIAVGGRAWRLAPLRGGSTVAVGLYSGAIELWDLRASGKLGELRGHTKYVFGLTQLPDGRLASASYDTTVRIWDVAAQRCVGVITAPAGLSRCCVTAGGHLAVGCHDGNAYVYDVAAAMTRV